MSTTLGYIDLGLADRINNAIFRGVSFVSPTSITVRLATNPAVRAAGTTPTEVTGGGYAAVTLAANATNFSASSAGVISNGVAITFPQPTGSGYNATSVYATDNSGRILFWFSLTATLVVTSASPPPSIAIGALIVGAA